MRNFVIKKHAQLDNLTKKSREIQEKLSSELRDKNITDITQRLQEINNLNDEIIKIHNEADEYDCSLCKKSYQAKLTDNGEGIIIPIFDHVIIPIRNVSVNKVDGSTLFKDFTEETQQYLVFCPKCALKLAVVTKEELKIDESS